jgi:succinate dehydrogenase/fumarate reductase-like Fe-S protein
MQQEVFMGLAPMSEFTRLDRSGIRATSSEIKDTCRCLIYCQISCPSELQPPQAVDAMRHGTGVASDSILLLDLSGAK